MNIRLVFNCLVVLILLLSPLLGSGPLPARAAKPLSTTRDVCPNGCTYSSIQVAIDAADPGDTVQVGAGDYTESLTLDKAVSLRGAGAATTVVQASSGRALTVSGGGAITVSTVISGFTFTDGSAAQGGGIYIDGDTPLVAHNVISGNSATSEGGGVYAVGITETVPVRLEFNTVQGNSISGNHLYGGGIYARYARLENNTITQNGVAASSSTAHNFAMSYGGGIYAEYTSISDNTVTKNTATATHAGAFVAGIPMGGGLYVITSTVTNNIISSNHVTSTQTSTNGDGRPRAGGIYASNSIVVNNTVSDNTVYGWSRDYAPDPRGGGIFATRNSVVSANTVEGNYLSSQSSWWYTDIPKCYPYTLGSGIYAESSTLNQNVVVDNTMDSVGNYGYGGGIYLTGAIQVIGNDIVDYGNRAYTFGADPVMINNIVRDNQANYGGGVAAERETHATLTNNLIVNNQASVSGESIFVSGPASEVTTNTVVITLTNNTIANATLAANSEGLYLSDRVTATLVNNIVSTYTTGLQAQANTTADADHTLFYGVSAQTGGVGSVSNVNVVTGDPRFVNPPSGDYHLDIGSAAIDTGTSLGAPDADLDGNRRPAGTGVDIGAYEYAFIVTQFDPLNASPDVAPNATVSVTFNLPVSATTITSRTFTVRGSFKGIYTGTYTAVSNTVQFDPAQDFKPGEEIAVNLNGGIRATTGISLTPYAWQFRTVVMEGSGMFTDTLPYGTGATNAGHIAFGDVDGDDDQDLIVAGTHWTPSYVHINDGTGQFPTSRFYGDNSVNIGGVAVGDFDNDGDLDIVHGGWEAQNRTFLNDGSGNFSLKAYFGPSNGYTYNMTKGDVDSDGDLDIIIAYHGGQSAVFYNDGNANFSQEANLGEYGLSDCGAAVGDVDDDGDLDIVLGVRSDTRASRLYLNDGTGQFPISRTVGANTANVCGVALGDIDDDGDLDLALGSNSLGNPSYVLFNDSTGQFPITSTFDIGTGLSNDLAFGDIDGDGDLDLAVGAGGAWSNHQDKLYFNNGTGYFTSFVNLGGASTTIGVVFGDIEGDGDLDIATGRFGQQDMIYINHGQAPTDQLTHSINILSFDNNLSPHAPDVIERTRQGTAANPDVRATILVDQAGDGNTQVVQIAGGVVTYTNSIPWLPGVHELDTASADAITDFITWARGTQPGARSIVALVGHGVGPAPEVHHEQAQKFGLRSTLPPLPQEHDFTPADVTSGTYLSTAELGRALAAATDNGANPLDLLFIDSCFEGNLDVLYEIRNTAQVFVASPNYAWAAFAYDQYLPHFTSSATVESMAQAIVDEYQAALDSTHPNSMFWVRGEDISLIAAAVNELGDALRGVLDVHGQRILDATLASQFADTTLCAGDLELCPPDELIGSGSFALNIQAQFDGVDQTVYDAAGAVLAALAEVHGQSISGRPWIRPEAQWTFGDPTPTIVAPLDRSQTGDIWIGSIYTSTAPLSAVWSAQPTQTLTISTAFAYAIEGRWDDFIAAWYGPLTPTVGSMCHAMLPVLIISDTEALALNVQPGLVDAQLDWSAAAHPDAADYALYARWPSGATWELLDTVPLTQTARAHTELSSGQYAYFVAARDATGDILARSDEIAVNVGVTSLNPDYGLNNVPAVVYIHGSGFQTPLTVTVGITQLSDVFVVDAHTIQAVIPAGLAPGRYDVSVHTSAGQAVAHSAYQAVDAGVGDDLQSFPEWLWTDPRAARVKPTGNRIGLNVQHWQGKNNVGRVLVEFRLGGPQGAILGQARTNFLPPGSIESTDPLTWTPQSAGDYYVCAIIDPYNDVSESDETNNVICRTIPVQPPALDTIPPVVEDIEIEHGASTTSQQAVTMDVPATDYPIPGASGMQACMFGEFEYILGAQRWVAIQWSDWVDYETAHSDYPWSLMPVFGMRYIQAWCADNAGNISLQPGVDVINLIPETQTGHVAQNGVVFYRIYLEQNQALTAHLTPLDGDPDLYVWGPDDGLWYSNNGAGSDDAVAFNAPFGGVYQVEVHGFSDARYQLTFATRQTQRHSRSLAATTKPLPTAPVVPLDEWPLYFDIDIDPLPPSLVEMSSGYDQDAEPGDVVTYTHTVMNTKATTDTLTLDVASSENWDVYLLGGDYPSGTLQLPLRLGSYMTATVVVSLTVPADAISGTVDHTVVTATSGISPTVFVTATDSTTVKVGMHLVFLPLVIKNQ